MIGLFISRLNYKRRVLLLKHDRIILAASTIKTGVINAKSYLYAGEHVRQ